MNVKTTATTPLSPSRETTTCVARTVAATSPTGKSTVAGTRIASAIRPSVVDWRAASLRMRA
jgi:hypothetical protein